MISNEEVKHIAKLARLGLTEKEIKRFQKDLSVVLNYIEKLKEVDVSSVKTISHSFGAENVVREDVPIESRKKDSSRQKKTSPLLAKKMLKLAPETKDNYIKVKSIIKTSE